MQKADVTYSVEPFCERNDRSTVGLQAEPIGEGGVPHFAQWYERHDVQEFIISVGRSTDTSLQLIHGLAPDHRNRTILVSVGTGREEELQRVAHELQLIAPDSAVGIVVRPTCVDPALAKELQVRLSDFVVGLPNSRGVDPLTGQLVIRGSNEAHRRVMEFLRADPFFSSLDSSTQAGLIRHDESSGPRRVPRS